MEFTADCKFLDDLAPRLVQRKATLVINPLRILCADDNVHVLAMLAETLRSKGHTVDTAVDGQLALNKIAKAPTAFDLVVTDSRMPRLDGFGLVEQARSLGYRGRVIVFATVLSDEDRHRYTDFGVEKIIQKPARAGELIKAIENQ